MLFTDSTKRKPHTRNATIPIAIIQRSSYMFCEICSLLPRAPRLRSRPHTTNPGGQFAENSFIFWYQLILGTPKPPTWLDTLKHHHFFVLKMPGGAPFARSKNPGSGLWGQGSELGGKTAGRPEFGGGRPAFGNSTPNQHFEIRQIVMKALQPWACQ